MNAGGLNRDDMRAYCLVDCARYGHMASFLLLGRTIARIWLLYWFAGENSGL